MAPPPVVSQLRSVPTRASSIVARYSIKTTQVTPFNMSSHLNWMIIRNNNAFLLKKRNISKPFSTEPNNLTNLSSYRYSGIVHRKSIGVVDTPDKKGFTVVYKKPKAVLKPNKATVRRTMKAGARRSLHKLKTLIIANKYRRDLTKAALRRASAVLRSQKPLPAKKTRAPKKAD